MAKKERLQEFVEKFVKRIGSLRDLTPDDHDFRKLRMEWKETRLGLPWRSLRGLYYFYNQSEVLYVGSAIGRGGLGDRIGAYIHQRHDKKHGVPKEVLLDANTRLGILAFDQGDWYWPIALEAHLIRELRPKHNNDLKGRATTESRPVLLT